jgi:hypothetical protein
MLTNRKRTVREWKEGLYSLPAYSLTSINHNRNVKQ